MQLDLLLLTGYGSVMQYLLAMNYYERIYCAQMIRATILLNLKNIMVSISSKNYVNISILNRESLLRSEWLDQFLRNLKDLF